MKFTSEDLLKAMGLKVGDIVTTNFYKYKFIITESDNYLVLIDNDGDYWPFELLIKNDYEIIQPKPTLTEDEKVILRNTTCIEISREMNDDNFCGLRENLWLIKGEIKYDFNLFRHLFKSVEIGHRYEIKVLLKEN